MELERKKMMAFGRQLSRTYSIAVLQIIVSLIGIVSLWLGLSIGLALFCVIISLACVVLIFFQPWKILHALHKGVEYKRGFEAVAKEKRGNHTRP